MTVDYYDVLLAGIAASMLVALAAGVATPVALRRALGAGAATAAVLLYVALFRNPPAPTSRRGVAGVAVGLNAVLLTVLALLSA